MKTSIDYVNIQDFFKEWYLVFTTRSILVLLALLPFVISCVPETISPVDSNAFTTKFSPLNNQTILSLEEIAGFSSAEYYLPVRTIRYSVLTDQLLIAFEGSSQILGWYVNSKELAFQSKPQSPNFKPISLDKEGKILLGAVDSGQEKLFGIGVWNMENGQLIECIAYPCDENAITISSGYPAAKLDPDAKYVVTFDDSSYGASEILGSELDGGISYVNSPDADYWWTIGDIAIDTNNDRLAIVFQEGRIWLDEVAHNNRLIIGPFGFYIPIANGKKNDLQKIYAAEFDPSGRWLAVVRGDRLLIYRVGKYGGRLVSQFSLGHEGPRILNFNPTSEFLFIGGEDIIRVIMLKSQEQLVDIPAGGVTAMTISDDNRLLIWGDKQGVIHIFGAPNQ